MRRLGRIRGKRSRHRRVSQPPFLAQNSYGQEVELKNAFEENIRKRQRQRMLGIGRDWEEVGGGREGPEESDRGAGLDTVV